MVVQGKPWLTPRPKAVIVVGLGQEGSLRRRRSSHTPCARRSSRGRATSSKRRDVHPKAQERARATPLELAATLIGSGGTGIAAGQAAQLIAQGVHEANERLGAASADRVARGRASAISASSSCISIAPAKPGARSGCTRRPRRSATRSTTVIERGTGPLPRPLDAGYRGADYDFITAETRTTPSGEVEIAYALDTKRARTEVRTVSPQGRLVRDLVKTASSDANDDPQIGTTLFKLLVPVDLESFLTGSTDMQIELDDGTAGIPWELLDDGKQQARAVGDPHQAAAEAPAARLPLERQGRRRRGVRARDRRAGVSRRLPAAAGRPRGSARRLRVPLRGGRASGSRVTQADQPTIPTDVGADARTVVNTLFERDWRIVHIAGHGALPEEDGSAGGVVLSNGTFLGPAEIQAMRVVPELVFINCCHSGAAPVASVLAAAR